MPFYGIRSVPSTGMGVLMEATSPSQPEPFVERSGRSEDDTSSTSGITWSFVETISSAVFRQEVKHGFAWPFGQELLPVHPSRIAWIHRAKRVRPVCSARRARRISQPFSRGRVRYSQSGFDLAVGLL